MYDVLCMLPWFCAGAFCVLMPGLAVWIPLKRQLDHLRVSLECVEVCCENNRVWLEDVDQALQELREEVDHE